MPNRNVIEWPDYQHEERRKAALAAAEAARSGQAKEVGLSDWMEAKKSTAEQRKLRNRGENGQQPIQSPVPGLPKTSPGGGRET